MLALAYGLCGLTGSRFDCYVRWTPKPQTAASGKTVFAVVDCDYKSKRIIVKKKISQYELIFLIQRWYGNTLT